MRSLKYAVFASLVVALLPAGSPSPAQQASWKNKTIDAWTPDEAYQVLKSSPWVKSLRPDVLHAQSEFERRDGGNMGRPTGLGFDGIGDSESEFWRRRIGEVPTLVLRWETARPVRGARKIYHSVEPPTLNSDAYSLAVYGLPEGNYKGNPIKLGKQLRDLAEWALGLRQSVKTLLTAR